MRGGWTSWTGSEGGGFERMILFLTSGEGGMFNGHVVRDEEWLLKC